MSRAVRCLRWQLLAGLFTLCTCRPAWGSPTGLNNIPTTDLVRENTLVLQSWLNMAANEHIQQFLGLKYGALRDVEVGVDWKVNDRTHGHATFQAKYAFDIQGDVLRGVVGVADLSDHRKDNGEYFPYAATSLDLKTFRLHFGFAPQPHNERFFGGIDKMVTFLDRNLQLRADAIHINDKEDMLFSAGFLYELGARAGADGRPQSSAANFWDTLMRSIILESWVSMPSTGNQEMYTIKLNYVIKF